MGRALRFLRAWALSAGRHWRGALLSRPTNRHADRRWRPCDRRSPWRGSPHGCGNNCASSRPHITGNIDYSSAAAGPSSIEGRHDYGRRSARQGQPTNKTTRRFAPDGFWKSDGESASADIGWNEKRALDPMGSARTIPATFAAEAEEWLE